MNGDIFFPILAMHEHVYVGSEQALRDFMASVLWALRSGGQRRTLPADYGKWNNIFKRFTRWCQKSGWAHLHRACIDQPDLQSVFIDSTLVRTHACAAGSSAEQDALDRSRGGFGTKIHVILMA